MDGFKLRSTSCVLNWIVLVTDFKKGDFLFDLE